MNTHEETFEFRWSGKTEAQNSIHNIDPNITLHPDLERSKNFDTTNNMIIEGDNLIVLNKLLNTHRGKVKCIYIDPPYNTGKGFVYQDNYNIGRLNNINSMDRRHSQWLNMIYPRLLLAKDFLRDDGVIFVSINDHEVHHLRCVMDEIFGEDNFVSCLIAISAPAGLRTAKNIARMHSYCVMYKKTDLFRTIKSRGFEDISNRSTHTDEFGSFYLERLHCTNKNGILEDCPTSHFPVYYNVITKEFLIDGDELVDIDNLIKIIPYYNKDGVLGRWVWSRNTMRERKHLLVCQQSNGRYWLRYKVYDHNYQGKLAGSVLSGDISRNEIGTLELKKLMQGRYFDYPKPVSLIKHLLKISTQPNDLILDFFAGSGTTGHATMALNQDEINTAREEGRSVDGLGGRNFILVQLPEEVTLPSIKKRFTTISSITIERIRLASANYPDVDNGFKVFSY